MQQTLPLLATLPFPPPLSTHILQLCERALERCLLRWAALQGRAVLQRSALLRRQLQEGPQREGQVALAALGGREEGQGLGA